MISTVNTAITNLIRRAEPDVDFRLEAQAEALKENQCIDTIVGQWIDANGVDYLKSIFDLEDVDFAKRFPSMAHVGFDGRQQMKAEITSHLERCLHCALSYSYQLELDARILRACRENRSDILQLLDQEDMELDESDHPSAEAWTSVMEHQPAICREPEIMLEPIVEPI